MEPTIAFVAGQLSGGGAERQLLYLLRGLSDYPVRLTLATLTPNDPGQAAVEALGIPVHVVPRSRWKIDRIVRLAAWLRRERPLLVHSWAFTGNIYTAWAGGLAGVPVRLGSLRGDAFYENTVEDKAPPFFLRLALEAPHAVVVNSGAAAAALEAGGPRRAHLRVVRNGMDLSALRAAASDRGLPASEVTRNSRRPVTEATEPTGSEGKAGLPPGSPPGARPPRLSAARPKSTRFAGTPSPFSVNSVVGLRELRATFESPPSKRLVLVGRLIPRKNAPMFLRVVAGLAERYPDVEGWLIGDGPERAALEAQARELGIASRIRFWGEQANVAGLLAQADVLCHCSHSEGLSNAIMEASALGLPVVATRAGGTGEIVDDGETGFIVDLDDAAAMVRHVDRLLSDAELYDCVGQAGRRKMDTEFSLDRMVRDMVGVYREWLEKAGVQAFGCSGVQGRVGVGLGRDQTPAQERSDA